MAHGRVCCVCEHMNGGKYHLVTLGAERKIKLGTRRKLNTELVCNKCGPCIDFGRPLPYPTKLRQHEVHAIFAHSIRNDLFNNIANFQNYHILAYLFIFFFFVVFFFLFFLFL
jgi:hypothetical protein